MKTIFPLIACGLFCSFSYGQTVKELYKEKNYKELVKLESKSNELSGIELYMIGFGFFRLENDSKAIEFYDKAMAKGLDDGTVHFYKGLSLFYQKNYDQALKEVDIALGKEPDNQEYMNQKGLIYKYQGNADLALVYFIKATELPNTYGEPFYWVAAVYQDQQQFKKALEAYYVALGKVPEHNSHYLKTLQNIGQLEYTITKNYRKSARAYEQAIGMNKENYGYYSKLMKAYNGAKDLAKADSVFALMKVGYKDKKLSADEMKFGNVAIAESEWKGQKLIIYKSFIKPEKSLDVYYKIYLISKSEEEIERTFMVEQTIQLEEDGVKYLLCEKDRKSGSHITYPYGWKSDSIEPEALTKAVELVLTGKLEYGASSNFGGKK